MVIPKKIVIFQDSVGVQHFPGRGPTFPGWIQLLIPIETYRIWLLSRGGGGGFQTPCPYLYLSMNEHFKIYLS